MTIARTLALSLFAAFAAFAALVVALAACAPRSAVVDKTAVVVDTKTAVVVDTKTAVVVDTKTPVVVDTKTPVVVDTIPVVIDTAAAPAAAVNCQNHSICTCDAHEACEKAADGDTGKLNACHGKAHACAEAGCWRGDSDCL